MYITTVTVTLHIYRKQRCTYQTSIKRQNKPKIHSNIWHNKFKTCFKNSNPSDMWKNKQNWRLTNMWTNKNILHLLEIKSFGAEKQTRALTFSGFKSFPWTLTRLGSTLWPLGLLGSNPNSMPATWGNRPSSLGYADTPFSKAWSSCWPVI